MKCLVNIFALACLALLAMTSCGTKKNTPTSRQWQAFTTRYNVYFNGSEHYKETLHDLEEKYEDDYSRLLLAHPAEARADSKLPQPTGDFKRTVEKMQKAIQLHSIKRKPAKRSSSQKDKDFRAREEFNPFLHNAWLMMAKAQYFDGNFLDAASTFLYISKHFTWLPKVVTEARLWQARCYCALDWNYEAENILHLVKEKDLADKSLRHLYNLVNADYLVRSGQYDRAVPFLREAAASASGSQKHRLWFLLGQVYARTGNKSQAYEAFKKAGSGVSTPYRVKFNARIKQSEVYQGHDIKREINALHSMAQYERNKEFLDQIYYAIANLYLSRGDTLQARKNYILAVEKSTRGGIDKALAQLALGEIYFNQGEYALAQPCYAEALPVLPENYPDRRAIQLRSDILDELAVYAQNVHLQDSLLTLAAMTPQEQRLACQKIVDDLIKREKEEREAAAMQELMAKSEAATANAAGNANSPTQQFTMNTDKSWYFYNTMTKNAGKTEFQRRWGARKLEDDWRRRNKNTFSLEEEPQEGEEGEEPNGASQDTETSTDSVGANDPHSVEYYLRQIPSTPQEISTANDIIQEGLYNMAVILKDKLEDYRAARKEFMRLENRYPDNPYRLDVYYNMYLMAVRENDPTGAETWRQKILSDFPDSPYGQAMTDPHYFDNLRRMHQMQEETYQKAYEAYLENDNSKVHDITGRMEKDFPLSPILPKFVFIDALSYLTQGDYYTFKERLTELLQRWPDTDMTPMASGILKGIREGRKPRSGESNARGLLWDIRLQADGTGENTDSAANFEIDPDAPQYLVLAFPRDSVNANELLYEVARFNFSAFVVRDFDLEPMSFSNIGLLVVKGFANLREVEKYRSVMERADIPLLHDVRPIIISRANFELLLREGRSFEEYFRFVEQKTIHEKEALENPPGQFEQSDK